MTRSSGGSARAAAHTQRKSPATSPRPLPLMVPSGRCGGRWPPPRADWSSLAFAESADHLERLRRAAQSNGVAFDPETMVDVLVMEADGRIRGGDPGAARVLLEQARQLARHLPDPDRLASVALAMQRLGARTAMPRVEVASVLNEACSALAGTDSSVEARVTASLARELAHSVRADHARAEPLSERALEVARRVGDPATLALCLLARHDVVWGPGTASERQAAGRRDRRTRRAGHRHGPAGRGCPPSSQRPPRARLAHFPHRAGEVIFGSPANCASRGTTTSSSPGVPRWRSLTVGSTTLNGSPRKLPRSGGASPNPTPAMCRRRRPGGGVGAGRPSTNSSASPKLRSPHGSGSRRSVTP